MTSRLLIKNSSHLRRWSRSQPAHTTSSHATTFWRGSKRAPPLNFSFLGILVAWRPPEAFPAECSECLATCHRLGTRYTDPVENPRDACDCLWSVAGIPEEPLLGIPGDYGLFLESWPWEYLKKGTHESFLDSHGRGGLIITSRYCWAIKREPTKKQQDARRNQHKHTNGQKKQTYVWAEPDKKYARRIVPRLTSQQTSKQSKTRHSEQGTQTWERANRQTSQMICQITMTDSNARL